MGREAELPGDAASRTSEAAANAIAVAPPVFAVLLIALAAALLDPERNATPFVSSTGRSYFVVVALLGAGLAGAMASAFSRLTSRYSTFPIASAFLITAATSLVIVERVRPGVILILVILAAGVVYSNRRAAHSDQSSWTWLFAVLALVMIWTAIAGLSSFQLQGVFALPVTAAIAWAGAVVADRSAPKTAIGVPTLAVVAIVGAEIQFALSFILLNPFVSAALWVAALALAFGLTYFVSMRVSG